MLRSSCVMRSWGRNLVDNKLEKTETPHYKDGDDSTVVELPPAGGVKECTWN